jgi:hypothetical protein
MGPSEHKQENSSDPSEHKQENSSDPSEHKQENSSEPSEYMQEFYSEQGIPEGSEKHDSSDNIINNSDDDYDVSVHTNEKKIDVEKSSFNPDDNNDENSPIPEVAAIVSNKDDPSLPVMTFRYYIMAIVFSLILSFFNQFL